MKTALTVNRLPKTYLFFLPTLLFFFTIFSCSNEAVDTIDLNSGLPDLVEVLESYSSGQDITAKATDTKDGDYEPTFDVLSKALARTKLASTVSRNRLTVFAPTDDAFAALGITTKNVTEIDNLVDILLYHVVEGTVYSTELSNGYVPTLNGAAVNVNLDMAPMVYINDAMVTMADIKARNGVIHVIDKILFPPTMNLVEKAASFAPEFSILLAAATKAGLAGVLMGEGPYEQLTVFAPTNQAFIDLLNNLPDYNSLDDFDTEEDIALLTSILLYHVVEGRVYSSDLSSGPVTTLNGAFNLDLDNLTIDGNAMLEPSLLNVQATNGVIHVIDAVLVP